MKQLRLIFAMIAIPALAMVISCGDDIVETDLSADISYEYIMDAEMLNYFDMYAEHYDTINGLVQYRPKIRQTEDGPKAVIAYSESTREMKIDHAIRINVSRKPGTELTHDVTWTTQINLGVNVMFADDTNKYSESSQTNEYNLTPETFDSWAETYIYRMSVGYQLYIQYNGNVNFSTE